MTDKGIKRIPVNNEKQNIYLLNTKLQLSK